MKDGSLREVIEIGVLMKIVPFLLFLALNFDLFASNLMTEDHSKSQNSM